MSCHCHEHTSSEHHHSGHCSEHHHKEIKKLMIIRLTLGALVFSAAIVSHFSPLYFIAYLILGYDVIIDAVKSIKNIFNESFLMTVASLGAFAIGEYPEAAAVMLLYQLGEFLSHNAVRKSKKSITALMDLRSDTSTVLKDGRFISVPCEKVLVGDIVRVSSGEKIPLDGIVTKGSAYLDTSSLTGESAPVFVQSGSEVLSGSVNKDSVIEIKVTREFSQSTVSKILELISSKESGKSEKFITKFAKIYTPIVVFAALAIAVIPSVITGDIDKWVYTALTFLMVSCPCALVISVPLTFVAGIGGASKKGILLKGSYAIEALSSIKQAAFDKTGTLTEGSFRVCDVYAQGISRSELLEFAAYAECFSSHPIARAIVAEYGKDISCENICEYREIAGKGVSAVIDGKQIRVGTYDFAGGEAPLKNSVFVNINGVYSGYIVIEDRLKSGAKAAIEKLKALDIKSVMLTGDSYENAENVASELGIPFYAGLLPQDKIKKLEDLGESSAFIGDGINDAPVISCADIGISMGGIGSDAAIEASDAVIMTDAPEKVAEAVKSSKRTMKIVWENIIFAISIKVMIMILSLFGMVSMWSAVFVDVGVCLLAVLNSIRAYKD